MTRGLTRRDLAAVVGGEQWAQDIIRAFAGYAAAATTRRTGLTWPPNVAAAHYEASGRTGALDASQPGEHRHTVRISRTIAARLAADQKTREASEWARRLVKAEAKAKKLRRHIATLRGIVKRNEKERT